MNSRSATYPSEQSQRPSATHRPLPLQGLKEPPGHSRSHFSPPQPDLHWQAALKADDVPVMEEGTTLHTPWFEHVAPERGRANARMNNNNDVTRCTGTWTLQLAGIPRSSVIALARTLSQTRACTQSHASHGKASESKHDSRVIAPARLHRSAART